MLVVMILFYFIFSACNASWHPWIQVFLWLGGIRESFIGASSSIIVRGDGQADKA
jgi:hypothetical protein